jgi:RNA polymerase sigma factor (sigma-70 family)
MSTWIQHDPVETDAVVIGRSFRTPKAFGEVFDRHWDSVYRYCRSRAGDAGEDLAAETFRLAFDRRGTYELDRADAGPWLLGLANNLIRNHLRGCDRGRRAVGRLGADRCDDLAEIAMGRAEAALLGPALAQALDGIPDGDRDALLLMAWNDLSYQEVAEALDVPIGTVRSRISRARLRLRARLSDLGFSREDQADGLEERPVR